MAFDFLKGLPTEYLQTLNQGLQGGGNALSSVIQEQQQKKEMEKLKDYNLFSKLAATQQLKPDAVVPPGMENTVGRYTQIASMFKPEAGTDNAFMRVGNIPVGQAGADEINKKYYGGKTVISPEMPIALVRTITPAAATEFGTNVKVAGNVATEAKKNLNTQIRGIGNSIIGLKQMQEIATKLPEYKSGIFNQTYANIDAWSKKYAKDPNFVQFSGAIGRTLSNMARVLGERGVLTDQDIIRTAQGIGADPTIPLAQKVDIYNKILDLSRTNLEMAMEQANMQPAELAIKDPTFYRLIGGDSWAKSYKKKISGETEDENGTPTGMLLKEGTTSSGRKFKIYK